MPEADQDAPEYLARKAVDPDYALIDHLMDYQRPPADKVVRSMERVRAAYKQAALVLLEESPRTPDRSFAFRKTHEALMAAIASIALNQEEVQ